MTGLKTGAHEERSECLIKHLWTGGKYAELFRKQMLYNPGKSEALLLVVTKIIILVIVAVASISKDCNSG